MAGASQVPSRHPAAITFVSQRANGGLSAPSASDFAIEPWTSPPSSPLELDVNAVEREEDRLARLEERERERERNRGPGGDGIVGAELRPFDPTEEISVGERGVDGEIAAPGFEVGGRLWTPMEEG